MNSKGFVSGTVCLFVMGCSIHPQVEDFSRAYLPEIVNRIRCETKQAILEVLPQDPKDEYYYLRGSGVNFDFSFTITERDEGTSKGSVQIPISLGTFTAGWDAGLKKERTTTILINTTDSFLRLESLNCDGEALKNFKYPITGHIGVSGVVRNFYELAVSNRGLFKEFSDQLRFTTDIYANATPSVRLLPNVNRLVQADLNLKGQRLDVHQVKLSFDPPDHPADKAKLVAEIQAAYARERARRIAELKAEKAIPDRVMIVGPDGKPVDPKTLGAARSGDANIQSLPQTQSPPSFLPPPVTRDSTSERRLPPSRVDTMRAIEQRTRERFLDNESRRINQRLLDELRNR